MALLLTVGGSTSGAKTVTNTVSYDSYTKLMPHIENNLTDNAASKTVTNNNATFSGSAYKVGGYAGVFNGSNAYLSRRVQVCDLNP